MARLTHLDKKGNARMVDITAKDRTVREAVAQGKIVMMPGTVRLIEQQGVAKGDVFGTARIAGIMAAKRTDSLIPLCHPLLLTDIDVRFAFKSRRDNRTRSSSALCQIRTLSLAIP